MAASLAFIAITFVNSPEQIIDSVKESDQLVYTDFEEVPGVILNLSIYQALKWVRFGVRHQNTKELGVDRYEIMYVVYEGNKIHLLITISICLEPIEIIL